MITEPLGLRTIRAKSSGSSLAHTHSTTTVKTTKVKKAVKLIQFYRLFHLQAFTASSLPWILYRFSIAAATIRRARRMRSQKSRSAIVLPSIRSHTLPPPPAAALRFSFALCGCMFIGKKLLCAVNEGQRTILGTF